MLCSVILRPNLSSQWKFQMFSIPELWNKFSGKWNPNSKKWSTTFKLKPLRLKTHHFHWKLLCQKPMLRQIEWRLLNGPITKSGVLPGKSLFFWKTFSSFRTSYKELLWCTNYPNVHIRIFRKHWSLILGCFFPLSILKKLSRVSFYKVSIFLWFIEVCS